MKSLAVFCMALFLGLGFAADADAKKKRFGSGGFGKSFNSAPAKSPAGQNKTDANQSQAGNQNNLAANNGAAKQGSSKKGMLGGLMGGLLAGGLIAAMLGGGFEGIQFMDILLIALVAFILFKLFKSRQPAPAAAGHPNTGQTAHQEHQPEQAMQRQSAQPMSGGTGNTMDLPAGFDKQAFIDGALDHYRTLQTAWNEGNLDVVREYVAPTVYAQLHNERKAMDVAPQTEVLDLSAELVRAEQDERTVSLSILFKGRCKDEIEGTEDGIFDTWHLEKDKKQENAPWMIVGIEAE